MRSICAAEHLANIRRADDAGSQYTDCGYHVAVAADRYCDSGGATDEYDSRSCAANEYAGTAASADQHRAATD